MYTVIQNIYLKKIKEKVKNSTNYNFLMAVEILNYGHESPLVDPFFDTFWKDALKGIDNEELMIDVIRQKRALSDARSIKIKNGLDDLNVSLEEVKKQASLITDDECLVILKEYEPHINISTNVSLKRKRLNN